MPQLSTQEFERLPLRVHSFMAGVRLHDVWSVDLPHWHARVTLNDFLQTTNNCTLDTCDCSNSAALFTPSALVRMLLNIRFFIRRILGWDNEPATIVTFATRLTDGDRSRSLIASGTRNGFFRVVYRFENEQLVELINRTAHAVLLTRLPWELIEIVLRVSPPPHFCISNRQPVTGKIFWPELLRKAQLRFRRRPFRGKRCAP